MTEAAYNAILAGWSEKKTGEEIPSPVRPGKLSGDARFICSLAVGCERVLRKQGGSLSSGRHRQTNLF